MLKLRSDVRFLATEEEGASVYLVRDPVTGETFQFDEIEHFLLRSLDKPRSSGELARTASEHFGISIPKDAVEELLDMASDWGLLESASTENAALTNESTADAAEALAAAEETMPDDVPLLKKESEQSGGPTLTDQIPTASTEAIPPPETPRTPRPGHAFDPRGQISLFNPEPLFRILSRFTGPVGRPLAWFILPAVIVAGFALYHNLGALETDFERYYRPITLVQHLLIGLLSVNLLSQLTVGTVLSSHRVSIQSFGLRLALGLVPRFALEADDVDDLPRPARIRIHSTPLLVRLGVASVSVVGWLATRGTGTLLPGFYLTLALVALISLALLGNPLLKAAGYRLLTAYLDEPLLREKASRALFRGLTRRAPPQGEDEQDTLALRAYALASIIFLVTLLGVVATYVARWLELNYQGTGVALFLLLLGYLVVRFRYQIQERRAARRAYRRSAHRAERITPAMGNQPSRAHASQTEGLESMAGGRGTRSHRGRGLTKWGWRRLTLLAILGVVLALPYPYETGGRAEIFGAQEYELHTETPGVVKEVLVEGGEWVSRGTVLARLASYTQTKDFKTTKAAILEQKAQIEKLKSTPRPEEVDLAKQKVKTAEVQAYYSKNDFERLSPLYEKGNISAERYANAEAELELDRARAAEARANLQMVNSGPHPMELEAAKAELNRLEELLNYHKDQIERTVLRAPIDGRPVGLTLTQDVGKFLDRGNLFTTFINDRRVRVELAIPESDVGEIDIGSNARVRVWGHPHRTFTGRVVEIAPTVDEESFGRVVRVTVTIPNEERVLKSGMTGFGKVAAGTEPVIVAFSRTLVRFFLVEVWSWLP